MGSNLLMSLFMVISIPVLHPFLQILFQEGVQLPANVDAGGGVHHLEQWSARFFNGLIQHHGKEKALLLVCSCLIAVFLGKNLFRYLSLFFLAPVRNGVVRDIRVQLNQKMLDLPLAYFSEARKGDLMSRVASDVQEIEWSIVGMVESVAREPLVILGSVTFMAFVSPPLLGFVLVLMVFSAVIIGGVGRSLRKQSGAAQQQLGLLAAMTEETLGGLRVLKGFNAEDWQNHRYARAGDRFAKSMTRLYQRKDLASPLSEFMGIGVLSVLLWFGGRQVFSGAISAPTFLTFLYAFYNVIEPAKSLSGALYSIRKGRGAMERVAEVLQAPNPIKVDPIPVPLHQFTDKITFDQVSFRYPRAESDAVHRVSFTLHKGEIVALLGASGAGKSTVADLLPRFHDVTAGRILIDGTDIRDCPPRALRQLMGIVGQDPILFHDTVFNNIALGMEDAEENDVKAAAMAAHAHEFIEAMPLGYHTQVGDRGVKLSGGQRQRLTIARAILKNPPILILDEATSALDSESEKLVQEALNRLLTNRTALIIAHRLSTIRQADKILVMENGEIVESGNHQSLMKKNGIYRKLVELQKLA